MEKKLKTLEEMLKKKCCQQGRGRMNLLGKRIPGMDYLPIRLEQKENDQFLYLDLNKMPHLSVTGGTSECQAALIRRILKSWEPCSWIKPVVIDLLGTLNPEMPAVSEKMFISKLYEMLDVLEHRYNELATLKFKNAREYLDCGHKDMPFHPVIISGIEKMADSEFRKDMEILICRLAQKGRAAGIDLILCSADAKILKGSLGCHCPAKLVFRSNDEKNFSLEKPFD